MNRLSPILFRPADTSAVVFAMVFPTLVTYVYFVHLAHAPAAWQQTAYTLGKTIQFAFPLVWVLAVQRERLRLRRPGTAGLWEGLLFGAAVFVAMLALYHLWLKPIGLLDAAGRAIREKVSAFGIEGLGKFIAMGAFYSLVHSLLEEYYWRWFVFGQLQRLISWKLAVALSSLAFTGHHVLVLATYFGWASPAVPLFSLAVAVGGAFWAWLYHKTGSLYGPWLSHLLIDAAIFTVGYDLIRAV